MRRRRSPPASDELRERFAINLRECRRRVGISQEELAFRADVHARAIWPLEGGRKLPRIDTFIRLAGALGVRPSELVAGIAWEPAETIVAPGAFEVGENAALAAEVAELRGQP